MLRLFIFIFVCLVSFDVYADLNDSSLLDKAEKGDVCAQGKIGRSYAHGQGGLEQNYDKALEWYEKAANSTCKDEKCLQCQGEIYLNLAFLNNGYRSQPVNKERAFYWFLKAAESGKERAFQPVAEFYADGQSVGQDYEKAYYWARFGHSNNEDARDFTSEIKSRLTPQQIKKIDDKVEEFQRQSAQKFSQNFASMIQQVSMGFNPATSEAERANARLGFEIGLNKFYYSLNGIKKLIDRGALKAGSIPSNVFLFKAQERSDLALVKLLIQNGADIQGTDERGFTVLHRAIGHGHTDIALALISEGANLSARNDLGRTPLMEAAARGDLEVVNALIKAGVDVNYVHQGGHGAKNALSEAYRSGGQKVVDILMDAGAVETQNIRNVGLNRKAQEPCAKSSLLCPDQITRVLRSGPSCAFPACPVAKKPDVQHPVKGTFSEIDTKASQDAVWILQHGTEEDVEAAIKKIQDNAGDYNPEALGALSGALFSRIRDEEGAFWFIAADLRNHNDNIACNREGSMQRGRFHYIVQQFKPYAASNADLTQKILDRVLIWDQATPYNYDIRWVVLKHGVRKDQSATPLPDDLCIPKNKMDQARAFGRNEYRDRFKDYIKVPDNQIALAKLPYLTGDEFSVLLSEAESGDAEAQYKIATTLLTKEHKEFLHGDSKSFRRKWLLESVKGGNVAAMTMLGREYLSGYGVASQDRDLKFEEGKALLIKAGQQGSLLAHGTLGKYYLGKGDPIEAYAWYALAEYILQKKNPALKRFPAKEARIKLEATLADEILEKAQKKAEDYIQQYGTQAP